MRLCRAPARQATAHQGCSVARPQSLVRQGLARCWQCIQGWLSRLCPGFSRYLPGSAHFWRNGIHFLAEQALASSITGSPTQLSTFCVGAADPKRSIPAHAVDFSWLAATAHFWRNGMHSLAEQALASSITGSPTQLSTICVGAQHLPCAGPYSMLGLQAPTLKAVSGPPFVPACAPCAAAQDWGQSAVQASAFLLHRSMQVRVLPRNLSPAASVSPSPSQPSTTSILAKNHKSLIFHHLLLLPIFGATAQVPFRDAYLRRPSPCHPQNYPHVVWAGVAGCSCVILSA